MKIELDEITYKYIKMLMKDLKYKDINKCLQCAVAINYLFISIIKENEKKTINKKRQEQQKISEQIKKQEEWEKELKKNPNAKYEDIIKNSY